MKISTVIVTFNRKQMLKKCVLAVCNQTYSVSEILIIDNCSSDGTDICVASLIKKWGSKIKIHYYRMSENLGGAGGFEFGISKAFNQEADFIWLMDDDGEPALNCLKELLMHARSDLLVGPLVVSSENDALLAFPVRSKDRLVNFESVNRFKTCFPQLAQDILFPFNGTLLPRKVVKNIGLPRGCYFIWGDEIEYCLRSKKAGYELVTITSAIFYHPKKANIGTKMMGGLLTYNYSTEHIKNYCIVRNSIRNYLDYKNFIYALLFAVKTFWFHTFTKPSLTNLGISFRASIDALKKDFSKHKQFLNKTTSEGSDAHNN